jgi:Tfp pilus assembly protein PilV
VKRGQTLLEGMIAAMILAIGVTAIIQAILFSTIQNAGAGRITEAASISGQVASGLSRYDLRQLQETNAFLSSTWCVSSPSAELLEYTGGIETVANVTNGNTRCAGGSCASSDITATPCVVDIDAYDATTSSAPANRRLVAGYDYTNRYEASPNRGGYKRVAVVFDDSATSGMAYVTVVTSFLEAGRRRFVRRNVTITQAMGMAGL